MSIQQRGFRLNGKIHDFAKGINLAAVLPAVRIIPLEARIRAKRFGVRQPSERLPALNCNHRWWGEHPREPRT